MTRHLPFCLLAAWAFAAAHAQPAAPEGAAPAAPAWRSAFDGYQPFAGEKTLPWREANDTVQRVGGWRAYAREAAQPAASAASPPPKADPHGVHHKP